MGALTPTEAQEQAWLAAWLDATGLLWCHVPNGGRRHVVTARNFKRQGVKAGVPDVLIFTPPPLAKGCRVRTGDDPIGCAIELKRAKGGTTSREQKTWLDHLDALRWATYVAKGADAAIAWLRGTMGYGHGR